MVLYMNNQSVRYLYNEMTTNRQIGHSGYQKRLCPRMVSLKTSRPFPEGIQCKLVEFSSQL